MYTRIVTASKGRFNKVKMPSIYVFVLYTRHEYSAASNNYYCIFKRTAVGL